MLSRNIDVSLKIHPTSRFIFYSYYTLPRDPDPLFGIQGGSLRILLIYISYLESTTKR